MLNKQKLISYILSVVFILTLFLSFEFVLIKTYHEHDHLGEQGECSVCIVLDSCQATIQKFGLACGTNIYILAFAIFLVLVINRYTRENLFPSSLLLLKVRLDN